MVKPGRARRPLMKRVSCQIEAAFAPRCLAGERVSMDLSCSRGYVSPYFVTLSLYVFIDGLDA